MFAMMSMAVIGLFLVFALALPFWRKAWVFFFLNRLRSAMTSAREVTLFRHESPQKDDLFWMRTWGIMAAASLVLLAWGFGYQNFESPGAVGLTVIYILGAALISCLILVTLFSFKDFMPKTRLFTLLKKSGIQGLWHMSVEKNAPKLQMMISNRSLDASFIGVIGVTGHTLLGTGKHMDKSLLHDAFTVSKGIPGQVLLLHPEANTVDPERRQLTVIEEVLTEMNITEAIFRRQLRAVCEAIDDLNAERPRSGQIEIRLYREKPAFVGVMFDNSTVVAPWQANPKELVFVSAATCGAGASFFNVYRSQFLRLWSTAHKVTPQLNTILRQGSQAVRARKVTA